MPSAVLEAATQREGVALGRPLGSDTSLPVTIQSGFDPSLWSADQKPASVSTLRQCFTHQQQQPEQAEITVQEASAEQPDIWAALEWQPSPVITLRQRYMQEQQLEGQGSTMQPGQAVLELMPEDIVLQEASSGSEATAGTGLPSSADGHQTQTLPPDSGRDGVGVQQAPVVVQQQAGLPPQYAGVSARAARRHLQKLPSAVFSEPQLNRKEDLDRGVHFGSGIVAADKPEAAWQQAPQTLPRARSSLKKQRSPRGSLRKRSFRWPGSSVSFAAVSTASDDSSGDSGASVSGKSKARTGLEGAAGLAAPLVKTVSSVWAMISSGLAPTPAASARTAVYQPARSDSPDLEADLPHVASARPPQPAPRSGSVLWQIASNRAAAGQLAPRIAAQPARSLSRFGSFREVVAQAATTRPSMASNVGPEHLELGVKMLLEAKQKALQKGSRLDSLRSPRSKHKSDWGGRLDTQQTLAKVMQVLNAKQMGKSVSMASTVQVTHVLNLASMRSVALSSVSILCCPFSNTATLTAQDEAAAARLKSA